MSAQGVVTLCDKNYFPGLVELHASIQTSKPHPLVCYDIGLTPEQLSAAERMENLTVLELPQDPPISSLQRATVNHPPLRKAGKRLWPLWICPLLIRASPFDEVFWLDCDLLVLRGLDELFGFLAEGPVFTPENKAPDATPNADRLYDLLPIARDFDRRLPVVNAGVSGWRRGRDEKALEAYIRPIAAAAEDPAVMDAISWHDQGALIWAIQSLGLEHCVLSSPLWNLSVQNVRLPAETVPWDEGACNRLRLALPDVRVLHWNGRQPPWIRSDRPTPSEHGLPNGAKLAPLGDPMAFEQEAVEWDRNQEA
jgi:hypothetical protein